MNTEQILRQVVELRIHGINNATPESMLETDHRDVVRVEDGADDAAGFFRRRADGSAEPATVREAYWWGGLSRITSGERSGPVLSAAVRVGWVLLLPFGLANIAYWSRPLDNGRPGRGAVSMRLFGLALTVLLVSTMCTVTMDLYALQCYSGGGICRFALPLSGLAPASRVAWASLVPMAVLAGLWLLTATSRARYEEYQPPGASGSEASREPTHQVLGRRELWHGGAMVAGLSYLHVAAGIAVVVIASGWPAVIGPGASCRTLDALTKPGCVAQRADLSPAQQGVFAATTGLALLVLVAVVILVVVRTADAPDVRTTSARWTRPATSWVFAAALLLYAGQFTVLQTTLPALTEEGSADLPGSNAAPTLAVALMVGIAVAGLAWRSRVRLLPEVFGAAVGLGLLATPLWPGPGLALAVLGGMGVVLLLRRGAPEEHRALRRTAPGVLLGVSLMVALGFSAVVLLGAGYVLNRGASASNLLSCDPTQLCVPRAYVVGGTSVLVAVFLTVLLTAALLVLTFVRAAPGGAAAGPVIQRARRWAALAHRAEPVVVVLGSLGLLAAAGSVAAGAFRPDSGHLPAGVVAVADGSVLLLALVAMAVMVLVVVRSLSTSSTRPMGLVWDLLCVLPRAAHPFAPPCYAERAVPELADRVRTLVRENRLVVLSAHSLGAVLAIAAYFRLNEQDRHGARLLTYGSQLRPYFGRLFPDLFGPQVLGTQPCPGARLWTVDPWADDRQPAAEVPEPTTVLGELGAGWLSLWRSTDPLGFPVRAYPDNNTDRCAAELLPDGHGVQAHSGYPLTTAYAEALANLR